jgi:hypothetical protein
MPHKFLMYKKSLFRLFFTINNFVKRINAVRLATYLYPEQKRNRIAGALFSVHQDFKKTTIQCSKVAEESSTSNWVSGE